MEQWDPPTVEEMLDDLGRRALPRDEITFVEMMRDCLATSGALGPLAIARLRAIWMDRGGRE